MSGSRGLALSLVIGVVAAAAVLYARSSARLNVEQHNVPAVSEPAGSLPASVLVVEDCVSRLGRVPSGSRTEGAFTLHNNSTEPVELDRIETSCECLAVEVAERAIAPGARVKARYVLDLGHEPRFAGSLSLTATGHKSMKAACPGPVFEIRIEAEIVKGS
jgi:hypothetical protein